MSDPINLPLLRERLALAHGMVSDLCKRQGEPGWRRWEMSIPANPSRDPDLVIAAGLDAGDALAVEVERLTTRVAELEARAGDVARIVGWLRAKSSSRPAATGSNEAFGRGFGTALLDTANCIERGDWRDQPADLRPSADRVSITPALLRRMEAAGFTPGSEEPVGWLVGRVEAAGPKWVRRFDDAPWFLMVGTVRLPKSGIVRHPTAGRCWEMETCDEHPNEVAAARAVCARLRLPEILTGLLDAAGVADTVTVARPMRKPVPLAVGQVRLDPDPRRTGDARKVTITGLDAPSFYSGCRNPSAWVSRRGRPSRISVAKLERWAIVPADTVTGGGSR